MPYVNINADVDVREFLEACYSKDIEELIEQLRIDGHISKGFEDCDLKYDLIKISESELQLSLDEINTIKAIADRCV